MSEGIKTRSGSNKNKVQPPKKTLVPSTPGKEYLPPPPPLRPNTPADTSSTDATSAATTPAPPRAPGGPHQQLPAVQNQTQGSVQLPGGPVEPPAADPEAVLDPHTAITRRPYLGKPSGAPANQPRMGTTTGSQMGQGQFSLDFNKLLSSTAHVSWGQLLKHLPPEKRQEFIQMVDKLSTVGEEPKATGDAAEVAAVQAAVTTIASHPPPENVFAPFTVPKHIAGGQLQGEPQPAVHWANVDTGSMVNIVYSGALQAFPSLKEYAHPFQHVVRGVGDNLSKIICKLVDVPVCLGEQQHAEDSVKATFYVLECPSYHFIFGLALLQTINGGVLCRDKVLTYTTGSGASSTLQLQPRSLVKQSLSYQLATSILTSSETATLLDTTLPTIAEGWEGSCLEEGVVGYVQEALVDLAAFAALDGDRQQHCGALPLIGNPTVMDVSMAILGEQGAAVHAETSYFSPDFVADVSHGQLSQHPVEMKLAANVFEQEYQLPAWQDATMDAPGTPRRARQRQERLAVKPPCHSQAAATSTPQDRGYSARRKKGKPISKAPIQKHIKETSNLKIVLTGPDYVGCTTTLQILKQNGYRVEQLAPRPSHQQRGEFDRSYFELLVSNWAQLTKQKGTMIIEESPWSYLLKHSCHVAPLERSECQALLAHLDLPHLHLVLHTSGVSVGRRHPLFRAHPEVYSPTALRQMTQLSLLHRPSFFVDATVPPPVVARRILSILGSKVFRGEAAAIDGLDHLLIANPSHTQQECEQLADKLQLKSYTMDDAGQARLGRLANVLAANEKLVNPELDPAVQALYYQVVYDRLEIFGLDLSDLKEPARAPPFQINTFGPPVHKTPIRCSPAHAAVLREQLQDLKMADFIDTIKTSAWAAPAFLVPKPRSTKLRMVIDYRGLNGQTRRDSFPIPNTKDVLQIVAQFAVYCKLDLLSGFYQIAIEADSQDKTGVVTSEVLFTWRRMPFGVRNGPPCFQRVISTALFEHQLNEIVGGFIDDLATGGADHARCAANLDRLFVMLAAYNLKAGAEKVFLGLEKLDFLGYTLQSGTISPDGSKVEAISRLLPPHTRTEVRAFLGLTGYYREFIYHYSHIAKPLTQLLEEDRPWEWTAACQAAFDQLKKILSSSPILANPDPHRSYTLHTDYSHTALGAVLEQLQADGKWHVVAYASRTCSKAESRLGPTDGEFLAILYAVEKFHHYLAGTPFTIVTDHSALVHLESAKTKNPKLARWAMRLAGYEFTLKHRAGRVHNNADGLSRSRAGLSLDTPSDQQIAIESLADPRSFFDDPELLFAALEALDASPYEDGDSPALFAANTTVDPEMPGPRQLLLEAAPCHHCLQEIPKDSCTSIICDRCNKPYHLQCLDLQAPPPTYWYCQACAANHAAAGFTCPTQDVALQRYLLGWQTPPHLRPIFLAASEKLSFKEGKLLRWYDDKWLHWPPIGLQVLLLEEIHHQNCHVGGEKMYHILHGKYYWPSLRADCYKFASTCFECQLSGGRATGGWSGQLLPLPAGPRVVWSVDLINNLGPAKDESHHVLVMVDNYSKFCLLSLLPNKSSAAVTSALQQKLFSVFGAPAALKCDNGTEFKGDVKDFCAARGTKLQLSSPYTSRAQGQVERLNRTVETLLRRIMTTLPPATWHHFLPDIQLAINTTYAKAIGCPPYLVMFGSQPPASALSSLPDPSHTSLTLYTKALQRQLTTIQAAAAASHKRYKASAAQPSTLAEDTLSLTPGRLAMIVRPRTNKLFTRNAGPFIVTGVTPPHVFLQSLTHGTTLKEHSNNVRPFHLTI